MHVGWCLDLVQSLPTDFWKSGSQMTWRVQKTFTLVQKLQNLFQTWWVFLSAGCTSPRKPVDERFFRWPSSTQFNLVQPLLGSLLLLHLWKEDSSSDSVQLLSCQPPPTSSSSPLFVPAQVYALLGLNHHSLQMTYEFFRLKYNAAEIH